MSVKYSKSPDWNLQTMFTGSPQTTIITKEGLSVNISTMLLKTFSSLLGDLLSLHPCLTTCIIIPDFSISTVSNLIQIINSGFTSHCKDVFESTNIERLANIMGLNIKTLEFGRKNPEGQASKSGKLLDRVKNKVRETENLFDENLQHKVENDIAERIGSGISVSKIDNGGTVEIDTVTSKSKFVGNNVSNNPKLKIVPNFKPRAFTRIPPHKIKHTAKRIMKQKINLKKKLTDVTKNIRENSINNHGDKSDATYDKSNNVTKKDVTKDDENDATKRQISNIKGKYTKNFPRRVENVSKLHNKIKTNGKMMKAVKLLSECQLCEKSLQSEGHVLQHLVQSHFLREVRERFSHLFEGTMCLLCEKNTKNKFIHIGATHRKVNDILVEKGLKPVHAKSMLKEPSVKREIKEESATSDEESGNVFVQREPESEKLPSIDEVLKKYAI